MKVVGEFIVVVEIRKYEDGQVEPCVEKRKPGFLKLPATVVRLKFRLDDVRMRDFASSFEIVGELQESVAFVVGSLRDVELSRGRGNTVIAFNDRHNQSSRRD